MLEVTRWRSGQNGPGSAVALALGLDFVALAIDLAFWTLQRQADVLALSRIAWREIDVAQLDLAPRHAAELVNARGRVMGFRLQQQKTGTCIDAPLPPSLHDRTEAALRASNGVGVFVDLNHPKQQMPAWQFQRAFREAQDAAWAVAIMDGDEALATAIEACQYRDLRRTGMIAYKDAGAALPNVTALSGHAVLGRRTILDTYMPGDTAGACACVAAGIAAARSRKVRREHG
jgi:hypothetical protein